MDGLVVVAAVELDRPAVNAGPGGDRGRTTLSHEAAAHVRLSARMISSKTILEVAGVVAHGGSTHEDEGLVGGRSPGSRDLPRWPGYVAVQVDAGVVVAALGVAVVGVELSVVG